ncbi:MAG: hypothetical protein ACTSV7_08065 [Candidatus Baldrarchaeia archaeon]
MKNIYVIISSINVLTNIQKFKPMLANHDCKTIIIDEGDEHLRIKNKIFLSGLDYEFYGPSERKNWFKQRFGSSYERYACVIPERCHAETSFGFLVAYEGNPDLVIELDDDVFPFQGYDIIDDHIDNLFNDEGVTVRSKSRWYNTLENFKLSSTTRIFPRGHPYAQETRKEDYIWDNQGCKCVLNMGLWAGDLDLDALTILYNQGLKGKCSIKGKECKRNKIVVDRGTYFAICSMNTSFTPRIIPAFYQLYMNFMGVDRFDDIWSGMFFKKIADHLGHKVCLGKPLVYHDKRPRNVFSDLKKELDGMMINEVLWKIVDSLNLEGKTYWDSYNSLIQRIEKNLSKLKNNLHQNFLAIQAQKMLLWLKIIDKLM